MCIPVPAQIVGQLGMKRRSKDIALLYSYRYFITDLICVVYIGTVINLLG